MSNLPPPPPGEQPPGGGSVPPPPPPGGGYPPPPPGGGYPPPGPPQGGYGYTGQPAGAANYIPEIGRVQDEPWKRIVARIIDWFVLLIPSIIIGAFTGTASFGANNAGVSAAAAIIGGLLGLVVSGAYYILMVNSQGATLGKMALGLEIVDQQGQRPSIEVAARRWAPDGIIGIIGAIPVIGILAAIAGLILLIANLVMIFSQDRQTDVYDMAGGTYVVKKA